MISQIRVLIVDDERYAREELIYLLQDYPLLEVVGGAEHGEAGILQAIQTKPDVVFLDVEMPKMNGMEVAKALLELKKVPLIVFATAYPQFAVEAFRFDAIDYLLKPYEKELLQQTIERIEKALLPQTEKKHSARLRKLAVENDGEIDYVSMDTILYVYPEGKYCHIVTSECLYTLKSSLKELEDKLGGNPFFRVHRSYLVNLQHVVRLTPWFNGAYELELAGVKEKIPVSRNFRKSLQAHLDM